MSVYQGLHAIPVTTPRPVYLARVKVRRMRLRIAITRVAVSAFIRRHPVVHAYVLTLLVCAAYVIGQYYSH